MIRSPSFIDFSYLSVYFSAFRLTASSASLEDVIEAEGADGSVGNSRKIGED